MTHSFRNSSKDLNPLITFPSVSIPSFGYVPKERFNIPVPMSLDILLIGNFIATAHH